jgi:hypothetical protein
MIYSQPRGARTGSGSNRKLAIKILVAANPNPNIVLKSLRHGAIVARHSHRPKSRIGTQTFQL